MSKQWRMRERGEWKVGMKGCEENAVPGIENERGSEEKVVREEKRGGGSRRGDGVSYKQG